MSSHNQRSKDSSTDKKLVAGGEGSGKTVKSSRHNDGDSATGGKHSAITKKQNPSTSHKTDGKKS